MRCGRARTASIPAGASAIAAILCSSPRVGAEVGTLSLHFEGGGAAFLSTPQRDDYFGLGGSAGATLEWAFAEIAGVEAAFLFAGFSPGDGPNARPDGRLFMAGAGVRLRPINDSSGFLWHVGDREDEHEGNAHGDLWLSAHVGWVRTGAFDRVGFDAGAGYELSLWDGLLLGPFVRWFQVVHWDDPLDDRDAFGITFGLGGTICLTTCSVHVPPPDSDGDGINDRRDRCPLEPEDPDGFRDDDGCPDPDNDGDGIADPLDACPMEPEDFDGRRDEDGCPEEEIDSDGDTILDDDDGCPLEPEDLDRFRDGDGCPDPDNDGDTIPDARDACPDEAEVINGVDDEDGCPDQTLARVVEDRIVLEQMLHFEFGTAILRRDSLPVLEAVARLLTMHPQYARVTINGYADHQGDTRFNLWLSQRRSERIRELLIGFGVAPERLEARGFGEADPIADGTSIDANRENRRVEFVITEVGGR